MRRYLLVYFHTMVPPTPLPPTPSSSLARLPTAATTHRPSPAPCSSDTRRWAARQINQLHEMDVRQPNIEDFVTKQEMDLLLRRRTGQVRATTAASHTTRRPPSPALTGPRPPLPPSPRTTAPLAQAITALKWIGARLAYLESLGYLSPLQLHETNESPPARHMHALGRPAAAAAPPPPPRRLRPAARAPAPLSHPQRAPVATGVTMLIEAFNGLTKIKSTPIPFPIRQLCAPPALPRS